MPFIYALCEPDSGEVRYVGKANKIKKRMTAHRNEKATTRKCRWLASLRRRGLEPLVKVLEEVPDHEWEEAERNWIAHFRKEVGFALTNHADGGEGRSRLTEEERAALSVRMKERMTDPSLEDFHSRESRQAVPKSARQEEVF